MPLNNYRDFSEEDGTIFVLQNIPAKYNEDLIINYVENTLDIDVKEVRLYPFIPGRALVYLQQKLEDFHEAGQKIAEARIESKKMKLLVTSKEAAVVVNNLDVQKLSEEFLCLYFESEFADGHDIVEFSRTWPELNIAIVRFHQDKKTVLETVLEKSDHVPLPSEDYHICVQPYYNNFHDYIGQQMVHNDGVETEVVFDNDSEEEEADGEEEEDVEVDIKGKKGRSNKNRDYKCDTSDGESSSDEEDVNVDDIKGNKGMNNKKRDYKCDTGSDGLSSSDEEDVDVDDIKGKKGRNNKKSDYESITDSSEESSSDEEDVDDIKGKNGRKKKTSYSESVTDSDEESSSHEETKSNKNEGFEKDKKFPSQKTPAAVRGGFSGRGVRGKKGGHTSSSRKESYEKDTSNKNSNSENKWRGNNTRGRGSVQRGLKHTNNSHKSFDTDSSNDRKLEINLPQRSAKLRGGASVFSPVGAKHYQSSSFSFLDDRNMSQNQGLENHLSRSLSLGQHLSKSDMNTHHNTSLASYKSTYQGSSSYISQQNRLPEKEIKTLVSQSLPQQDPAFKKAQEESQEKYQRDLAAKDAKIKQLEEELSKKAEPSKNLIEKIQVTAWQKEFLPHCFGRFDNCYINFDEVGNFAVLEGDVECVKEHQLRLLKELKKLKEEIWALTPDMHYVLSKEQGKRYLHSLNSSSQLNGAKVFLQDQSLLVVAKDDQTLHFALDFLKARLNYKETTNSAAKMPLDRLNLLQSNLEQKYLVRVSWSNNETVICVEGIKDDVFATNTEITTLIEEYGVHEKSFSVNGAHAKLFHNYFNIQIKQLLEGVEIVDMVDMVAQVDIKFKGNKRTVNLVHRKLEELKTKVAHKSCNLRSEFKKPEDLMLISKGFTSEKMKTKVDSFEVKNKCVVITNLPSLETFNVKASKKSRLTPSTHQHSHISKSKDRTVKTVVPKQVENKLILKVSDTCQLIIKPYGDIIKESSDILVCVLTQKVDLRKTRVGQVFNKVCHNLWKILKAEHEAHPTDAVLTTKGQFNPLKCLAICHIILTPWNPASSPAELSTAITCVLNQAVALGAKSVSFPVLGCGRAFGFPPSDVATITCASVKASNLGSIIQKVVLLAPDSELFKEFKTEAPKHFQPAPIQVQGAVGGALFDETVVDDEVEDSNEDEDEDSEDDEAVVEMSHDLQKSKNAEISIVAMHDSGLENLWSILKKDIEKVCLRTDYFNQEIADFWPNESRENIIQEAIKLCVWVERSPNPKTKKPGYFVKGEKEKVEKMLNIIKKEFDEFSSNLPKHRIKSDKAPKRGTCEFLRHAAKSDELWPSYWKQNSSKKTGFLGKLSNLMTKKSEESTFLVDVDSKTKEAIKKLVIKTWEPNYVGHGNDAKGLSHSSIKITKVKRIENRQLFETYSVHRKQLFTKMCEAKHTCPDIGKINGSKGRVVTTEYLEDFMKEELYYEVNEHYLFHGTRFPDAIVVNGIDPRVSSDGAMFGKGIYTAEKFTKSDQYTDSRKQRSPPGTTLHMILARVLLGNVYLCDDRHKSVANIQSVKLTRPPCMHCKEDICNCKNQTLYDSVMGDGKWIFREFVVYDKFQCYPEYLISYQRV